MSNRFFVTLGAYLDHERPRDAVTDRVFVALQGRRRGKPLSLEGIDEILQGARRRAGLERGTCHELRHAFITAALDAGVPMRDVQEAASRVDP